MLQKLWVGALSVLMLMSVTGYATEYKREDMKPCPQDANLFCDLEDKPITGKVKFYHSNGNLEREGNLKDGKFDGKFRVYYENGDLKQEETYKNGNREELLKINYERWKTKRGKFKRGK